MLQIDPGWVELIITVVTSVIASSGVWTFITKLAEKKDSKTQLLIGLAHDRILHLCEKYIERGWLTKEEYDDLHKYLYEPYTKSGGNGSAEKMVKKVDQLRIVTSAELASMTEIDKFIKNNAENRGAH